MAATPIPKKSLDRKIAENVELNPLESAELKAVGAKKNNTELMTSLTKEQQAEVRAYIFSGGKEGVNHMAELRKRR